MTDLLPVRLHSDQEWMDLDERVRVIRQAIDVIPSGISDELDTLWREASAAVIAIQQRMEFLVEASMVSIQTLTDQRDTLAQEISNLEDDMENYHHYFTQSTRLTMDERVRDLIANTLEHTRDEEDGAALSAAYDDILGRLRERLGEILDIPQELVEQIIAELAEY